MMLRFFFVTMAIAALAACIPAGSGGVAGLPSSPAAGADRTTLDEQAMLAVELAYKAARTAAELAVDTGLLKGEPAARVAAIDARAFRAVALARSAYAAGNARSYLAALAEARTATAELLALVGRN